jgi:hypothetical protein
LRAPATVAEPPGTPPLSTSLSDTASKGGREQLRIDESLAGGRAPVSVAGRGASAADATSATAREDGGPMARRTGRPRAFRRDGDVVSTRSPTKRAVSGDGYDPELSPYAD